MIYYIKNKKKGMKTRNKTMKILIIEDDIDECNGLINCAKSMKEIEIIGVTDSDIEGLIITKNKHPDGIILDLELNNSNSGNTDSLEFLLKIKSLKLKPKPIIIVTTHVNSKRTYEILHKNDVDLILYKDHPKYCYQSVFNHFLTFMQYTNDSDIKTVQNQLIDFNEKISNCINNELDLIGISHKLKGRTYIFDALFFLLKNENSDINIIQYLSNKHKKSSTTIINGIKNAISYAWRISAIEDLLKLYTAKINYETGIPTPMEFIYYYVDKIKQLI